MEQKLRLITLDQQGLLKKYPFGRGRKAVKHALEHLAYIQIDTLSVVERAHHHTLWARIPDYQPAYLQELIREKTAFEYWYHAASYLPMSHYRFVLPQMSAIKRGESPYYSNVETKYINHVIDRIRIEGPLKARDFESRKKGNGKWWNWKPTKRALEKLFMEGELMISDRDGMEKIYDLRERVLPENINTNEPSLAEFAEYLVDVTLGAYGFTSLKQLTHLRTGARLRKAVNTVLEQKIEEGSLAKYTIEGMPTIYAGLNILDTKINRSTTNIQLLSPFDNAIIHRDRIQQIFQFDYKLECYVPKEKRRFGYFCLPILYNGSFIGRVDCKAHRKTSELELIHLHIEEKNIKLDNFISSFTKTLYRFAKFNDCRFIRLSVVSPKKLTSTFRRALNSFKEKL